jgi:hypothetical protein
MSTQAAAKPATKKPATKGSRSTETIIGTSATALKSALDQILKATTSLEKLSDQSATLSIEIADKENTSIIRELELEQEYASKKVDLELEYKANCEAKLAEELKTRNLIAVKESEHKALVDENTRLKADNIQAIKIAVDEAIKETKESAATEARIVKAENEKANAQEVAKVKLLEDQVAFYKDQVTQLYTQLASERTAGTERIKAIQAPQFNMGSKV